MFHFKRLQNLTETLFIFLRYFGRSQHQEAPLLGLKSESVGIKTPSASKTVPSGRSCLSLTVFSPETSQRTARDRPKTFRAPGHLRRRRCICGFVGLPLPLQEEQTTKARGTAAVTSKRCLCVCGGTVLFVSRWRVPCESASHSRPWRWG